MEKLQAFLENAKLLWEGFGITPLLYGSLGLAYVTGEALHAEDIDILIPEVFLRERWEEFWALLEKNGYVLTDAHEHTFQKDGISVSYARLEELETFAGIGQADLTEIHDGGVRFYLMNLRQYLKVYTTSVQDGYRINVRRKKDTEKIALIEGFLREGEMIGKQIGTVDL